MSEHLREEEFVVYLDGHLSPDGRTRVDSHLAACAACRSQLQEFQSLMDVLGEWKPIEPSASFDAALRSRVSAEAASPIGWAWLRPGYAGALATMVLVAVALGLWQLAPPESSAPPELAQTSPPETTAPLPAPAIELPPLQPVEADDLALLLENYELLEKFDALFEPLEDEEEL